MVLTAGTVCLFMGILPIINGQLSLLQTLTKLIDYSYKPI